MRNSPARHLAAAIKRPLTGIFWISILPLIAPSIVRADAGTLYGIHWWGYTPGQGIDASPATMMDCPAYSAWDVETVLTNSASWWAPAYFVPLYQDLTASKNVSVITRIDFDWGPSVPPPSNANYAGWPDAVVSAVNTLSAYSHIWIIGNEPNVYEDGKTWPNDQITPSGYATIYRNVRAAIHTKAAASPLGPHIVLIAPPSPGGIIPGIRWMDGNMWLGQVLDNIPAAEVDGFGMHAYGGALSDFHSSFTSQLALIDSKGHQSKPVYMTEWAKAATPGDAGSEAASAQFVRDSLGDVNTWNQGNGRHNIVCLAWFIFDANQQAGGGWNGTSIEYWRDNGNSPGSGGDLYTAFHQTADLHYPAGIAGTRGSGPFNNNTPIGTNLSLTATSIQTDSIYGAGSEGTKAVDGVVSSSSKWTSNGNTPPHWLALDLGASLTINGYILRLPGAAGELTSYNAKAMTIQSANSLVGPWINEGSIDNPAQANIVPRSYITPKSLRYIRLLITNPGTDNYARIPEFEVWGVAPPPAPPVANFTGAPTNGTVPLAVLFTDQSTGSISSRAWNFGDNTTSTAVNPSHTYQNAGDYTVSLTVTGPGGSKTVTKTNYITVNQPAGIPGDMNGDGDVDQADFGLLQRCYSGPGISQTDTSCARARLDADNDVDLDDFAVLHRCLSGANVAADPNCAN